MGCISRPGRSPDCGLSDRSIHLQGESSVFLMRTLRSYIRLNTPQLSLAFDAAYCYLLQCIQRVWRKSENPFRNVLFRNIHATMSSVLTPLAEILIKQPWNSGVAAPCFNYYAMIGDVGGPLAPSPIPLPPGLLHRQLSNRLKDAANATSDPQQKFTLERIDRYVNENVKPFE